MSTRPLSRSTAVVRLPSHSKELVPFTKDDAKKPGDHFHTSTEAGAATLSPPMSEEVPSCEPFELERKHKPKPKPQPKPQGGGEKLVTSPENLKVIQDLKGPAWIWKVDDKTLTEPSLNITLIESQKPFEHGQTHTITKHVGNTLEQNLERLKKEPGIPAAGGFPDVATAQFAINSMVKNPKNQEKIAEFKNGNVPKDVLFRVRVQKEDGSAIGTNTLRSDVNAGNPCLRDAFVLTLVLIQDPSFPEGYKYRVLTAYPEATKKPEIDENGAPVSRTVEFPALRTLFGAYLNQTWQDEYASIDDAIADFRAGADPTRLAQTISDLDSLLSERTDDTALADFVNELGCASDLQTDRGGASSFVAMIRAKLAE